MIEADIKRRAVDTLKAAGWYARRHEDQFGVGFPDMLIRGPNIDAIWAEWKVFDGNVFGPTPRQLLELMRIQQPHPRPCTCVIGYKRGMYYIAEPCIQVDVRTMGGKIRWNSSTYLVVALEKHFVR